MFLMSSIREIIASGTWLGIKLIPDSVEKMTVVGSAPGGFFVFGCLMALCIWIENKLNKPIERKMCGDCPGCGHADAVCSQGKDGKGGTEA